MELTRAKGTRDFLPEEKLLRLEIENTIQNVAKLYGFAPMETPALERFEILAAKFAGGEEILKEAFKLSDQGKRKLGLRYDLTVPLARVVASNSTLKLPFKRLQIGNVFRDGPLKAGRYREFMQADMDIVGTASIKADAEVINATQEVFKGLKIPISVRVNNRKVLEAILDEAKVKEAVRTTTILSLDKLEKLGLMAVKKELKEKGIKEDAIKKLVRCITIQGSNKEKIQKIKKIVKENEGVKEIEELLAYAPTATFDLSLARGLAYYTGMSVEVFATKSKISSSLAGGGRYDNMIGQLRGSSNYPAVGISFGVDVITDVLKETRKELRQSQTQVFIIPIKTFKESLKVAADLRKNNVNTELDLADKNISKNLDYANKKGIPFVVFIGPDELKKKKVKLRDMKSGKEMLASIQEVIKKVT